jgi:hypothetical protein
MEIQMRTEPVTRINRKVNTSDRMMLIISSMRKPQVRYKIQYEPILGDKEVRIEAQNQGGVCLYRYDGVLNNSTDGDMKYLSHLPSYCFVNNFV